MNERVKSIKHNHRVASEEMSKQPHAIVSQQEWIAARKVLLAKEKAFSKAHDQLSSEQRALPWVRVEKNYVFDGPLGKVTFTQLFGHRSQLFIKHFMMTPGPTQQCVGCSLAVDHIDQILPHLENHDVSYVVVARAPIEEIEAVRKRMDWHFPWVSSFGSDFNYDFDVSFTPEQIASGTASYNFRPTKPSMEDPSGHSVFFKDDTGQIFHTYSTYGRGDEQFMGVYGFFDVTPKGRDERGTYHGMNDWVSIRNAYGQGGTVGATAGTMRPHVSVRSTNDRERVLDTGVRSISPRRGPDSYHEARMTKKAYVVTGATGDVGKVVMERLKALGHEVRPISRSCGLSFDDAVALKQIFSGATGAFLMIPFDMEAPDLHKSENEIGLKLAEAAKAARLRRVVFLSGISAHLKSGSSLGAAMMEERLDRLGIAELVHVRGAFIMENFIKGLPFEAQAKTGVYSTAFKPNVTTPMIASKDIGGKIADLLLEKPFHQPRVRGLLGPRDYTMAEATRILGSSIGKPDVRYVQCSYEDASKGMLAMGVSPSFADAVMQTARSFNEGDVWTKERRSVQNTAPTTLEQFALDAFQKE